jgi:hypothetical protein
MPSPVRGLALVALLVACGKSAAEKAVDVELCGAMHTSADSIAQCLREAQGWKPAEAESAATARAHQMDSMQAELNLIAARADTQHTAEVRACDRVLVDLKTCLITRYGWEEDRATRVDDSVWNSRSAEHQRQIRTCLSRNRVGTGACLQLHYKWQPRRALALDDSIRRANLP